MDKGRLSLVVAGLLSGCMVGPDYERPAVPVPREWRFMDVKGAAELTNTAWWQQFQDPVLNRLIEIALQENKDIKIAAARIEQFLGQYEATRAQLFPQLFGDIEAGRQRTSGATDPPTRPRTSNFYQGILNLSYEIDLWGRLRRATEAARADLLSAEEARRAVILTLVAAVATAYTDLRSLDEQLRLARLTLESRAEWLRIIELRFRAGIVSALEVAQAQSDYDEVAVTIPGFERRVGLQEDLLSVLLGRNPGAIARGRTLDRLALPAVPAGLPSQLLERRPDIHQAEQDLIAANARIGAARALYFPTVSLTGALGTASTAFSDLFTGPAKVWQYSVPITQPIFTGGNIAGQVQTAEAVQQAALYNYQRVIQNAFREVEDALLNVAKLHEQLRIQARQVEALSDYQRLARLRYDNGYVSLIEVLDADRRLFNAQISYTQIQGQLFTALSDLYEAMGGGWVIEAQKLADSAPNPQTGQAP